MSNKRYVPFVIGAFCIGVAIWLIFAFSGWWRFIPSTFLIMFGWPTLKTALFASNKEIDELTGSGSISQETRKKFEDRI